MVPGRDVAARTMTRLLAFIPSSRVSSCDTIRFSSSPCALSRFGASASSSSMKMMAGALASACSNTSRSADSASPGRLAMISGPLTVRNHTPASCRTACAIIVLPEPAGPWIMTPRAGRTPKWSNTSGCLSGKSISSRSCASSLSSPPMSAYPIAESSPASSSLISFSAKISVSAPTMPDAESAASPSGTSTPITFQRSVWPSTSVSMTSPSVTGLPMSLK
mmetsp:Transcript_10482/g.31324  ORF Transcript_10482/g.31324 Transcript_10482/m.31324 type:complete len:221 (+) Transcript_10482:1493-2155(+)